jgi:ParB-like chromosome segregation protein Spo0J
MAKKYKSLFSSGSLIKDKGLIQHEQIKQNIEVYPELEALIPPLRTDEITQLTDNIQKEGCREALLVWDNDGKYILVDGHNRYRICQLHELDFKVSLMQFANLGEVKDWMIDNQLGRRNLTSEQASYLRGMRYELEKQEKGGFERVQSKGHSDSLTSERLAEEYNVSSKTIQRDANYAKGLEKIGLVNAQLKKDILAGNIKVSKSDIQKVAKLEELGTINSAIDIENALSISRKISIPKTNKEEKSKQIEDSKERIQQLLVKFGQGNKKIYEELQKELQVLGKLI